MPPADASRTWSYVFDEPVRILAVDDDPIFREFASVYLSTPLAQVETVADGQTALDRLLSGDFDIVLVDIEMPGIDGFELVERARVHPKLQHVPIVMLTGREDIASIDRAYRVGATSFTTKPVNWRVLSYQLRYVIRASKMERRQAVQQATASIRSLSESVERGRSGFEAKLNSIIALSNLIKERCGDDPNNIDGVYAADIAAAARHILRNMQHTSSAVEGAEALPPHQLRTDTAA